MLNKENMSTTSGFIGNVRNGNGTEKMYSIHFESDMWHPPPFSDRQTDRKQRVSNQQFK
jgi:hypothetical protein